ncbi:coenzyme F420 hydrogenase [Clostridiales bacterium PH28_bin88]|nr:coenzyme F420 hydrogenase [Clostridiales bacterium PH28_bin88]
MKPSFETLDRNVIQKGLCTACGTCAGICPTGGIRLIYKEGEPIPVLMGECNSCGHCYHSCPGEDIPLPDMELHLFGKHRNVTEQNLGVYKYCVSAYARDAETRLAGASGGVATALINYALEVGIIDCAIVAGYQEQRPWLPEGKVVTTRSQVLEAAQSKYTVAPVNAVINEAVNKGYKKIGVVGVPCHIEAIRKMQLRGRPSKVAKSIRLTLGLFCASEFYFEGLRHLLGEMCGVDDLKHITKLQYRSAPWPGHFAIDLDNGERRVVDRHRYVYHFLLPLYKRDRCEMCVDWAAEVADIAIGDYWSPDMKPGEEQGHSSCIVRSEVGDMLMEMARNDGVLHVENLNANTVMAGFGYEAKKHAAAFRLAQRQSYGWPVPNFHIECDREPTKREFHIAPETKQR